MWKHRSTYYLLLSLCFVPPVVTALLIAKYGVDLIDWDQWEVAAFFVKAAHGSLSISDLFAQQAEYRQFFPNLIFVVLGWLTHWNIKVEMFVSFLLACLIALNLYRLAQLTLNGNQSVRMLLMFLTTLLVFTPAQFESWLLGEQIIYFLPALCITTCLRVEYSRMGPRTKVMICVLLAIVSTFSSANGITCWLVIAPVLFFNCKPRWKNWRFAVWILGFLLSATLYLYNFHKPSYSPSLSTPLYHPLRALFFFCAFLGAPLMTSNRLIFIAAGLGAALVALFVLSFLYVLMSNNQRDFQYRLLPWLMLGSYSLITAIMVTAGRLGLGTEQALASRYVSFSVYLIISLFYLIPISLDHAIKRGELSIFKSRALPLRLVVSVLIVLHVLNSAGAIRQMAWMRIRRLESKACLLFINIAPNECLSEGFPELSLLRSRVNAVNELGFLRPNLIKSNMIADIADNTLTNNSSYGRFEVLRGVNSTFVASGWASLPGGREPANAVILTYQNDQPNSTIFAYAPMKIVQPSFKGFFANNGPFDWRWQKSISINGEAITLPLKLSAWAFDATTGKAHKLPGTYVIESSSQTPRLLDSGTP